MSSKSFVLFLEYNPRMESLVSSRDHSLQMFSFHEARGENGILSALMITSDRRGNRASKGRLLMLRTLAVGTGAKTGEVGSRRLLGGCASVLRTWTVVVIMLLFNHAEQRGGVWRRGV